VRARLLPLDQAREMFLTEHRAQNHSVKQISHYQGTFKDFDKFLTATNRHRSLRAINTEAIQQFMLWLKDTPRKMYRGSTERSMVGIYGLLKDVKAFSRWLMEEEHINWAVKVRLPKLPQRLFPVLSDDNLAMIFSCALLNGRSEYAVRNRAIFALLLDTGLRRTEIANLRLEDILQEQFVRVIGKGDKERLAPFHHDTRTTLRAWIKTRARLNPPLQAPLFLLKPTGVGQLVKRVARQTGLTSLYAHMLRHTCATKLVDSNLDIDSVKTILGHSQITTTALYLHQSSESIAAKHAAASPFSSIQARMPQKPTEVAPKRYRLKGDVA